MITLSEEAARLVSVCVCGGVGCVIESFPNSLITWPWQRRQAKQHGLWKAAGEVSSAIGVQLRRRPRAYVHKALDSVLINSVFWHQQRVAHVWGPNGGWDGGNSCIISGTGPTKPEAISSPRPEHSRTKTRPVHLILSQRGLGG